ncbi:MAG: divergent polysaccharide deacetylase family protein [Gammaproteobacteria bacterium]|nr:divergent polysaccharide deacetylase family protein [Gammaproteobacteria bacterium]
MNVIKAQWFTLCALFFSTILQAHAIEPVAIIHKQIISDEIPVISIVIDDLGNHLDNGKRAVNLPGAITYAFLPHMPYSERLAHQAHMQNKEVMLHLPMESETEHLLGPGGLTSNLDEMEFKNTMRKSINSIPFARGFNNHMGSLLTSNTKLMRWVMQTAMFRNDLYFVDSRTTRDSVALIEATKRGIRGTRRDLFLDYEKNSAVIHQQLKLLIKKAHKKGSVLAICHPYKQTLYALEKWLPTLEKTGIKLVPVSQLISIRKARSNLTWQLSSSR